MATTDRELGNGRIAWTADGSSNMSVSIGSTGSHWLLENIRLSLSSTASDNNFSATIDNNAGSQYDVRFINYDMTGSKSVFYSPEHLMAMHSDDQIDFAWTQSDSDITWGVEVVYQLSTAATAVSLGAALYSKLYNTTTLRDYISNRIYPEYIPQSGSLPCVTYSKISDPRIHAFKADPNINRPRYQLSSFSTSHSEAENVATQVKAALKDYSGELSTAINAKRILFDDENRLEPWDSNQSKLTFQIAQDYIIWWSS